MWKISKTSSFESVNFYKIPQVVMGFSNICEDLKGILVADYDNTDKQVIVDDFFYVQKKYKIPPSYLFSTSSNNYHLISLYKAPQSKIFEILRDMRVDSNFKDMVNRNPYKSYVLRISPKGGKPKPRFIELIGKPNNLNHQVSSAHFKLLQRLYKIKHPKYKNFDDYTKLRIQHYETK